jgi:hypothetical protein
MSNQLNERIPHLDEIFAGKQTAIPPAPGATDWKPIIYAVGGMIIAGVVIYVVVDAATKRQTEVMLAEMKHNQAQQLAAMNDHRQLLHKQGQEQKAFADEAKQRLEAYEHLLSKPFGAMKLEEPQAEA